METPNCNQFEAAIFGQNPTQFDRQNPPLRLADDGSPGFFSAVQGQNGGAESLETIHEQLLQTQPANIVCPNYNDRRISNNSLPFTTGSCSSDQPSNGGLKRQKREEPGEIDSKTVSQMLREREEQNHLKYLSRQLAEREDLVDKLQEELFKEKDEFKSEIFTLQRQLSESMRVLECQQRALNEVVKEFAEFKESSSSMHQNPP